MRRAQAALEFLTTYGWAFIVILVMIGALAYFGVLNPGKVTPERCMVEAGFDCREYMMDASDVYVNIVNKKGEGLKEMSIIEAFTEAADIDVGDCHLYPDISNTTDIDQVPADKGFLITCPADLSGSQGDKVKFTFKVEYKLSKGTYNKTFEGSAYATVQ